MQRADLHAPGWHEICIEGRPDERWATWFDGMTLETEPTGVTVLRGPRRGPRPRCTGCWRGFATSAGRSSCSDASTRTWETRTRETSATQTHPGGTLDDSSDCARDRRPSAAAGLGFAGASMLVPGALVALSAIPLTAGTLRLIQLAGGPEVVPADDRFAGFPVALVVHISAPQSTPWWASSSSSLASAGAT